MCQKSHHLLDFFHGLRATHIVVSSGQSLPSSPEPLFFNEGNERIYCALNYFLSPSLPHPKILNAFLFSHVYPLNLKQQSFCSPCTALSVIIEGNVKSSSFKQDVGQIRNPVSDQNMQRFSKHWQAFKNIGKHLHTQWLCTLQYSGDKQ